MRTMTPFFGHRLNTDLWSEMDKVFNDFAVASRPAYDEREFSPATEIAESAEGYLLSIDLPGIKKEDIKIDVADSTITISGERKNTRESGQRGHIEKYYGAFKRSFVLPREVELDNITAHYEDGVLELLVPKSKEAQPRKIEIQTGKSGFFSNLLKADTDDKK